MADIIYGICKVCGNRGKDYPATSLTTADSQSNIDGAANPTLTAPSKGVELIYYNGKLMCHVCKNRLESDEQSRISADKHAEAEEFRSKVGFVNTVE